MSKSKLPDLPMTEEEAAATRASLEAYYRAKRERDAAEREERYSDLIKWVNSKAFEEFQSKMTEFSRMLLQPDERPLAQQLDNLTMFSTDLKSRVNALVPEKPTEPLPAIPEEA